MAIDTRNKRASVVSFLLPGRPPFPFADGSIINTDRADLCGAYGAIAVEAEPPLTAYMWIYRTVNLEIQ